MAVCRVLCCRLSHAVTVDVGVKFLSPRYLVFIWLWMCLWLQASGLETTTASVLKNGKLIQKALSDASSQFDCQDGDKSCLKDKVNFEAIQSLHRMLDDDHNGNVDQSESDEFLRDELQYTDGFERQKTFHGNDKQISVIDLWKSWKNSQVFNWTVDDVLEWLETHVELPQYIDVFVANGVDGTFLPRLACSNSSFFISVLGIKNSIHRQKLSLKAMDTVLFGAPKKAHGYLTDVALVGSLVVALGGCWFAYVHHRYSQNHIRKMMKDLESLQKAEDALTELQEKLEMAEQRRMSPTMNFQTLNGRSCDSMDNVWDGQADSLKMAEEELAELRATLRRTEKQLENKHNWTVPGELQAWLQLTHEVEHSHYLTKRKAAEKQMETAKDECDKIRKRNRVFFGSLRMAHSSSLDDVDQWILHARAALEEVKLDLQERLHRWHAIENICNFPIMSNPGIGILRQMLCKDSLGAVTGQSNSVPSLAHNFAVEDADEDIPPFPTAAKQTTDLYSIKNSYYPCLEENSCLYGNHLCRDYTTKVVVSKSVLHQTSGPHSGSNSSLSLPVTSHWTKGSDSTRTPDTPSNGVLFHLGDSSPSPPADPSTSNDTSASGSVTSSNHVTTPVSSSSLPRSPPEGLRLNLIKDNGKHIPSIPYSASFHLVSLAPAPPEGPVAQSLLDGKRSMSTSGLRRLATNSLVKRESPESNDLDEHKERKPKKKALFSKIMRKVGNKPKST